MSLSGPNAVLENQAVPLNRRLPVTTDDEAPGESFVGRGESQ